MKKSVTHLKPAALLSGAALLALVPFLSGCAMGNVGLSGQGALSGNLALQGRAFGGSQPVSGATVQVFIPGTTGYGAGATALSTSTTTDANGFFNLTGTYTCPTAATPVYVTATGGNPGLAAGTTNAAIKLVSVFPSCTALASSTYVWINEVTTAAAGFALAQFATTSTTGASASGVLGAPNTTQAQVGLANAAALVGNLVNPADGTALTTKTITSTLGNITVTPEASKLYTIADVLAACVNSDGGSASPCATLFANVTPASGTMPTDIFQAAAMMNLNPVLNVSTVYGLQTATSPFAASALSTAPNDWTLGINYSAGASTTQTLLNATNGIAIDGGGNVWVINLNSSATATESLTELSPTGTPLANPFNTGATSPASMAATSPRNLAIDTNNNVFVTTSSGSGYVFEYSAAGVGSSFLVGSQPYGIAIDGSNNIFLSHNSGTTYSFDEFLGGTLAAANQYKYPYNTQLNQYAALTTAGNLVMSAGSTNSTQVLQASGITPGSCATGPCTASNDSSLAATFTPLSTGSISNPYGLAAAANGGVWVANNGTSTVTYISGGTGTNFGSASSFTTPRFVAVDGLNRAWFTNRGTTSISEITAGGVILSPVQTTSGSTTTGAIGFGHSAGMTTQNGIAIDPSGNVWVANGNPSSGTVLNSVFEMVGAAAPTVTPISLALKNAAVGVRP